EHDSNDSSTKNSKVFIAYFSRSGNTREIANQIHRNVGGDIFEIVTVNPYPSDYNATTRQAKQELETGYKPELQTKINNMQEYAVIYLGYPNWWGTIPMPVVTFLSQYDLAGKTIIPFSTHQGSGLGRSVDDIKKYSPGSTILEGLAIRGSDARSAQNDVNEWLHKTRMVK
ncbi:MAG: flavodoxin, partial [Sporomusa sp.]